MYGNCKICGARFGTIDGVNYYKLCEHMEKEKLILMRKLESKIEQQEERDE